MLNLLLNRIHTPDTKIDPSPLYCFVYFCSRSLLNLLLKNAILLYITAEEANLLRDLNSPMFLVGQAKKIIITPYELKVNNCPPRYPPL